MDSVSPIVLAACFEVHSELGPGLLESIYEQCLCHELEWRGIRYVRQQQLSICYRGVQLPPSHRADLIIEDCLLIELKAVDCLLAVHVAQTLTYLKLSGLRFGLLINFNVASLKTGIRRLEWRPWRNKPQKPFP